MALEETNISIKVIRKLAHTQATVGGTGSSTQIFIGEAWVTPASKDAVMVEWPLAPGPSADGMQGSQFSQYEIWLAPEDLKLQSYKPRPGDVFEVVSLYGDITVEGTYSQVASSQSNTGPLAPEMAYVSLPCIKLD